MRYAARRVRLRGSVELVPPIDEFVPDVMISGISRCGRPIRFGIYAATDLKRGESTCRMINAKMYTVPATMNIGVQIEPR
jgi:hypothetical protein